MNKKDLILNILLFISQIIVFYYFFCYLFPFKEQLQMFQFTSQYLTETLKQAGGVAIYISEFLSQFYVVFWTGPIISALLLTLVALLSSLILKKINSRNDLPLIFLLPWLSLLIISLDYDYYEQGTIAYLFLLLFLWLYTNIKTRIKFIYGICIIPILYGIAGPIVHLFAISALVYPSWHPSGKFVAFSINNTTQDTHPVHRTEVYDKASDVVVYDVEKQEIITTQALFSKKRFETFPTFSPDGKQLYFCSAPALKVPGELRDLRYSLCRVSFDPESRTFGSVVDTIFQAETEGQSILFPRVSPDGKYLLCTTTSYGTFPIWHKDADLCMFDLSTGAQVPTEEANSPDTDSYHSWSSNSKWVVFSSRRLDGLYTRPFIAHVGERGVLSKPFVLPQKSTEYYTFLTKSYNIPEFVKGKVKTDTYKLVSRIKEGKNQQISFTK